MLHKGLLFYILAFHATNLLSLMSTPLRFGFDNSKRLEALLVGVDPVRTAENMQMVREAVAETLCPKARGCFGNDVILETYLPRNLELTEAHDLQDESF